MPDMGSFAPIQVNLTEYLLSDIAENAVSFSYRLCMLEHYLITEYVHLSYGYSIVSPALIKRC